MSDRHHRSAIASVIHMVAEQIETGHIDGVLLDWTLGDVEVKLQLRRLEGTTDKAPLLSMVLGGKGLRHASG